MRLLAVLVVSAPLEVQRARVLARPNMQALPQEEAEIKFNSILSKQMPDEEKRAQPGVVVIDTNTTLEATRAALAAFVTERKATGHHAPQRAVVVRRWPAVAALVVLAISAAYVYIRAPQTLAAFDATGQHLASEG